MIGARTARTGRGFPLSATALVLLFFFSSLGNNSWAQARHDAAPAQGEAAYAAVRTEGPVAIDGVLNEEAWLSAAPSRNFVQKEPREGEPSTERTEFRVVYTADTLYIGVVCYDSDPDGILARERRRDDPFANDDTVSIVLDTFHDHRNAYLFRTNPLGTEYDALVTDEGKSVNVNWDERWDVAAQVTVTGWTVEFGIPFKSLRLSEESKHTWGIDLERVIRRKSEWSYWSGYRRGFDFEAVSQAGHLEGLENVETGLRLRIKPYWLGGFAHSSNRSGASSLRNASDAGIEVMKWRITPSLTADMTMRTDFAQTDVDDLQVNLGRFPLFFPEKREFFQEGAGIFDFGTATSGVTNNLRLFHSRTIGLSPSRRPVPIQGGGRVTGRVAGLTVGLLNVQTEAFAPDNIPASNYSVARFKRDVLSRSTVGAFLMNREKAGSGDFNRVYGMDGRFVFWQHFTADGFLAKSDVPRNDAT